MHIKIGINGWLLFIMHIVANMKNRKAHSSPSNSANKGKNKVESKTPNTLWWHWNIKQKTSKTLFAMCNGLMNNGSMKCWEQNVERSGHYSVGLLMHCSVNWPTNWIYTLDAPIFKHVDCGWYVLRTFGSTVIVARNMYGPDSITKMHEIYLIQHMEIAALHFIVIRYIACRLCEKFIQKAISILNSITRAFFSFAFLIHFPSSEWAKSLKWWRRLFKRFLLFSISFAFF